MSYRKQEVNIPTDWEIKRHEFYNIDIADNSSENDKYSLIFVQEDMLWIKKRNYNLDLGWYGGDDLDNKWTGFCIYLYRGDDWNKCDLLEKHTTRNKKSVVDLLHRLIQSVDNGEYEILLAIKLMKTTEQIKTQWRTLKHIPQENKLAIIK